MASSDNNVNNNSIVTSTTLYDSKFDDQWQEEMKALEEVERMQIIVDEKLPPALGDGFRDYLAQFPALQVMSVHRMMDTLQWDYNSLEQLLASLVKIPKDLMLPFINLLETFIRPIHSNVEHHNTSSTMNETNSAKDSISVQQDSIVEGNQGYTLLGNANTKHPSLHKIDSIPKMPPIAQSMRQNQHTQPKQQSIDETSEKSNHNTSKDISLVILCLKICHTLRDYQTVELVEKTSIADAISIIELCRHLPEEEMAFFYDCVDRITIAELLKMIRFCNEPHAKDCRLCKAQRLHRLEQNMINGIVPDGVMSVPGTMPLYESGTEIAWTACDERNFTIDPDLGQVYWSPSGVRQPRDVQVDMVRICDKCLNDVFKAITNQRRFEPLHHLPPKERLVKIRELRDFESSVIAEVVWKIEGERHRRRAREFSIRALKLQRAGLKKEAEEAEARASEILRQQRLEADRLSKEKMVEIACSMDEKWLAADRTADLKDLELRQIYTDLKQHLGFDGLEKYGKVKAPSVRKHSHTWKLSRFSENGSPISREAVKQVFGQFESQQYDDASKIAAWHADAVEKHKAFVERKEALEREKREKELKELHEIRLKVRLKTDSLAEARDYKEYMAQLREVDRIERRRDDRLRRREARFQKYLEAECQHMMHEDWRSYQLRDYLWQCANEEREREGMFNAELDQTEVDSYWGLDIFELKKNEEELRLRKLYEIKVREMNTLLVKTSAINQFSAPSLTKIGTLHEDQYLVHDEYRRRDAVIRKLRAEEVRGKLRTRPKPGYLNEKWKPIHGKKTS